MRIKLDTVITNLNGEPVFMDNEQKDQATIGKLVVEGLLAPDQQASGAEKMLRYKMAVRIVDLHPDNNVFTVEEAAKIKDVIGRCYSPLIVGRVYEAIEESK